MAEELLEQKRNYWIYEEGCFTENFLFIKYWKEKYPSFKYELVDTFETETSKFEVYYFTK